ncbi:GtrA family protein [Kitasatospora albolonga]|uniref:GtrA family protein n=1 Tax=Kitasatospora albolonga TaxID=68173 RepID=UPI0031EF9E9E
MTQAHAGAPSGRLRALLPELIKFGVVGGLGYVTDVVLFLLLDDPMGVIPARVVSLTASTAVAFVGNKYWTFRERSGAGSPAEVGRETAMFLVVSVAGALIQLACLGTSHYLLGFTSTTADLVSGSVIGMVLATAARFWGTKVLVFRTASA